MDSLDVQRHEAAATGVAKPAAGSVSKNSDVVIKDDSKSDNALLSSIEKLISNHFFVHSFQGISIFISIFSQHVQLFSFEKWALLCLCAHTTDFLGN